MLKHLSDYLNCHEIKDGVLDFQTQYPYNYSMGYQNVYVKSRLQVIQLPLPLSLSCLKLFSWSCFAGMSVICLLALKQRWIAEYQLRRSVLYLYITITRSNLPLPVAQAVELPIFVTAAWISESQTSINIMTITWWVISAGWLINTTERLKMVEMGLSSSNEILHFKVPRCDW